MRSIADSDNALCRPDPSEDLPTSLRMAREEEFSAVWPAGEQNQWLLVRRLQRYIIYHTFSSVGNLKQKTLVSAKNPVQIEIMDLIEGLLSPSIRSG
jgi:hypothetical protein